MLIMDDFRTSDLFFMLVVCVFMAFQLQPYENLFKTLMKYTLGFKFWFYEMTLIEC